MDVIYSRADVNVAHSDFLDSRHGSGHELFASLTKMGSRLGIANGFYCLFAAWQSIPAIHFNVNSWIEVHVSFCSSYGFKVEGIK